MLKMCIILAIIIILFALVFVIKHKKLKKTQKRKENIIRPSIIWGFNDGKEDDNY